MSVKSMNRTNYLHRFRFERLSYSHDEPTEIVDLNDMYRKNVAFIVRTHRKCLKYVYKSEI